MNTPPKSSALLILHAVLVFGQAIIWISFVLAGIAVGEIMERFEAVIVAPLAIYIIAAQYSALIRRRPRAAQRVGILLGALSLIWGYLAIVVFLMFPAGSSIWLRLGVFGTLEAISAQLWFAGSANRNWGTNLTIAEITDAPTPKHTFTLQEIFVITTIIAAILGLTTAWVRGEALPPF